ncbi:MAG: hypothetical protein AAF752_05595 [Bacteroidota bacterium]
MNLTVTIPRVERAQREDAEPVEVWPLVEAALETIEAEDTTRFAAEKAIQTSAGCCVLANFLNSQAKRVAKMDYRFKVPLIVLAANLAREDDLADSYYDPDEGAIYFETDDDQYSFHVFKDWTVDWTQVADEVEAGYEWTGIENQTWALDKLLRFL